MVTIKASHNVIPNQPTPQGRYWLSDADQIKRGGHAPTFYIYKTRQYDIERMCNSLSKILVHYYPVAGRLCLEENGRLEVECNAKGVTLVEAETTKTLSDYGDFSPSESIRELAPTIDYSQPIGERPLLVVQLTRFLDDQGLAIGMVFSHPLGDGSAWFPFINNWAKMVRGETLEPYEMPFLDRSILKFTHQTSLPCFDHPELKPLPLILGKSDNIDGQQKKRIAALLKLTSEQVEILKKKANDESKKQGSISRPYSRYEAIAAHIWRCASKARQLVEHQPTLVRFHVNFRNRLVPPLPPNYFGNALAITVTPTCHVGEIISNPLGYVAHKIREAVELPTNDHIRSQINVIAADGQLVQGERLIVPYPEIGNPNIHLTSWINMPIYDADFGWGKPVYFGIGYVCPFDRAIILHSPQGDGFFYQDIFTSRL